ncbi:hypothetical protein H5410_036869 [Solanum commersonii]|uniref:AIPP2-like SPOC-like domain-containing protein n=1 Tax=Solanum commersonii TaxID=4109 RepID=A0A9J5Y639_SOLCO|nr:hypothetical protein H5410_036869 [Solanum commersonii]
MKNSSMADLYDPALAHPPCRVRRKVYEFSGLLPDTLKLELVPHGDIWPSLFNNDCPGWNNEHFIWGLFYRTRQDTNGCAEGGNNKVIDIEIDMIVGEDVGTLDIVLHSWS